MGNPRPPAPGAGKRFLENPYSSPLGIAVIITGVSNMAVIRITCPKCGLSKDVAAEKIPATASQATCPNCNNRFPISGGTLQTAAAHNSAAVKREKATVSPSSQIPPKQAVKTPIKDMPIQLGGNRAKSLLIFFLLLVVVLVGVRLWADGKKRDVPFPNFIATSTQGVAVSWGEDVILLDHAGKVIGRQKLPKGTILTQLLYVGDELWHADHSSNSVRRLRNGSWETVISGGDRFRGAFKCAVDQKSGEIFVTDSSNHIIHQFMTDGRYVRSFGREGKGPGELKFPNSILFDQSGNLIVANTNCLRLDLFSRQGEFLKTIANVKGIGLYRYPTLMTRVGDRFAFLHTIDLRQAKGMLYGADGQAIGELTTPKQIEEAGDIAAVSGDILVSDQKERKVYRFSADTRDYLGPFSTELEALGMAAAKMQRRYQLLADLALVTMLVAAVPLLFFYLRFRRQEQKKITSTDSSAMIPPSAIWASPYNRQKLLVAVLIMLVSLGIFAASFLLIAKLHILLGMLCYLAHAALAWYGYLYLSIASGYPNPSREETLLRLVKIAFLKTASVLTSGERVEVCTAAWLQPTRKQAALLLLTNRRVLVCDYTVNNAGIRQFDYGSLAAGIIKTLKPSAYLPFTYFGLSLSTESGAASTLSLYNCDETLLGRIKQYLETRGTTEESVADAVICDTCYQPLQGAHCTRCPERKRNRTPAFLSLLFPGLGQFYNRELWNGAVYSAVFSVGILSMTMPVIKIVNRSAETGSDGYNWLLQNCGWMLFMYVTSAVDADLAANQGRKLFSQATGEIIRAWLTNKLAAMTPRRAALFLKAVPGTGYFLSGRFTRALWLLALLGWLLWTVLWSIITLVTGHGDSTNFQIIFFCSALVAMLWTGMVIDGVRCYSEAPPLRITMPAVLTVTIPPLLSMAAAVTVQGMWMLLLKAFPAFNVALKMFFSGYILRNPILFPGWGAALAVVFGMTTWNLGNNAHEARKDALIGFIGGAACWLVSNVITGHLVGSMLLQPLVFGLLSGLFIYRYYAGRGASPLIIPAVFLGLVTGFILGLMALPLTMKLHNWIGNVAMLLQLLALPAYCLHLCVLILERSRPTKQPPAGQLANAGEIVGSTVTAGRNISMRLAVGKKLMTYLILILLGVWLLAAVKNCSKTTESTPPAITKTEQTTISPYLEANLDSINNNLYCASFQMAWSKMRNQVIKEDIRLTDNPPTARQLNRQLLGNDDVSSGSYVAEAGVLSKELIERINRGLREKFGDQGGESFNMPQASAGERSIIAYAYLQKNLEFRTQFEKLTSPVLFQGNGSSTPVVAFGIEKFTYSNHLHEKLQNQVAIYDYRDDDDFILSLTSKSDDDEIILAKVKPGNNLLDTYQAAAKRIDTSKKTTIWENEPLKMPKIDFDLSYSFPELEGKRLLNNGWEGWLIAKALQDTRFKLDEKGAVLKSRAFFMATKAEAPAPGNAKPRMFIFDKPFLIYMKQKTGKYPYFALWINNPELMVRQ